MKPQHLPPVCILAGGRGTRLGAQAAHIPKPLVNVAGKPFLFHLLGLLRRHRAQRVVLCVGHLGHQIEEVVGAAEFGLDIEVVHDLPGEPGTARAVRGALPLLGDRFLVLYGDTYLRIDYSAVAVAHRRSGRLALMTVLRNEDRWDRSNAVFANGRVVRYDKRQPDAAMRWIDYGLAGLTPSALALAPAAADLADVYSELAHAGELAGFEAHQRFYEIGTPDALAATDAFLRNEDNAPGGPRCPPDSLARMASFPPAEPGPSLEGRRLVVVGATGGLGFAISQTLLAAGAAVMGTGRSTEGLDRLAQAGGVAHSLDLHHADGPGRLADRVREEWGEAIDGLVVAAGGYGPIGRSREVDLRELSRSLHDNLIASLALIQALAAFLDAGRSPSIALMAGGGASGAMPNYTAYALAKVGVVRLVENLALEEPEWRINAVAPGFVATSIHDATLEAGRERSGHFFEQTIEQVKQAVSPTVAASLIRFLMSEESMGVTGRLISAVWDPWRERTQRALLTKDPSFGKLRRIDRQRYFDGDASE